MVNKPPGSPNDLKILSFKSSFHGRMLGSLSTTHSKAIHKVDIPAFNWPIASFPNLRYPLEEFKTENEQEERRCLEECENLIKSSKNVAAMIIEGIQGEGGDKDASNSFFQGLQAIAKRNDVTFIVDEVQSGVGATGKFWAFENWNLETSPDIVVFSKKMQAAGFFSNEKFRAPHAYR